jgi:hypothetical protein
MIPRIRRIVDSLAGPLPFWIAPVPYFKGTACSLTYSSIPREGAGPM